MCPLDIPHSFVPGTKAKANEVNSNFYAVKTFVDANEINISQNEDSIRKLQEQKADVTGDVENKFQVANPEGPYDAVNKQTLTVLTSNTKDYIGGFELSKYDDTTITANPGSAWDTTYTYMFNQGTALQVSLSSTAGSGATKYIYIKGKDGETNELIVSDNSVEPEGLSSDYKYRRLGYVTTDSNGKILLVYSDSSKSINMVDIFTSIMPDWTKPNSRSINTSYTADVPGWVQWECNEDNTTRNLFINNYVVARVRAEASHDACGTGALVPVTIGDVYRCTGGTMRFFPMRGM